VIVDTKFTAITTKGWYRDETLKAGYLYQIYAYLRSQERPEDPTSPWNTAEGMLLHPTVDKAFNETVSIQGHPLRFVTVDLSERPPVIRQRLREIMAGSRL
jgi:5-methylcytosine-specific restriction enzyme subunit McrC